jgi:tetratricopeptide (TPR) repeat protein
LLKLEKYSHAIEDFSIAIKLNPEDAINYIGRAMAYACLGEAAKGAEDLDRVREIDPELFSNLSNMTDDSLPEQRSSKNIVANSDVDDEKVISTPSSEECFGDMQKQLQYEINELKVSAAAGDISAEEAEAKIKELEQLMQMLQP